jgi:hypothetical protein
MARIQNIELFYSATAGNKPTINTNPATDISRGEIALNLADRLMFVRVGSGEDDSQDQLLEVSLTAEALSKLTDVALSGLAENQALIYNADGKWHNVTLTSALISDFVEKVKTIALPLEGGTLTGLAKYNASVSEESFDDQSLVTKHYVDAVAAGYAPHQACETGSSANVEGVYADGGTPEYPGVGATFTLTANTGNATVISGVTLTQGMRVLLVGQTDQKQNGAYEVTTVPAEATGQVVLTRAEDFDGNPATTYRNASFLISQGTMKGNVYRLENETVTFGTDNITFVQTFAPTQYVGGDGITVTNNTVAIKQGATVKVIGGNVEVASGSGNEGKVLTAGGDGTAATWQEVDFSNFVTLDGVQAITGIKTFQAMPKINVAQTFEDAADDDVAKIGTLKEAVTYTDKSPNGATVAVGGIAKGEKLSDVTFVEFADKLLHPYVATSGVGLSLSPTNGGTFEMGTTQTVTGATVRWTAGSQQVTKAEVLVGGSPVGQAEVSSGTSVSVTVSDSIKANKTFTARATDPTKAYTGGNVTFTFVYPFYWGVVASGAPVDSAAIVGLTKSVTNKGSKTVSYTTSGVQQAVFAFPASYGDLKSIMDQNNFENIDTFTKSTVQVTGLDSTPQQYHVYVSNVNVQGFSYTFKF